MATLGVDLDLETIGSAASTATVSDALDMLGVPGAVAGIARQTGTGFICGPAFTVEFENVEPGGYGPAADYIDEVQPGSVVVLSSPTRRCTVWGDILSKCAVANGVAGTVIDGLVRDIDSIAGIGYSVWAAGVFMRSGKNRIRLRGLEIPVTIGPPGDSVTVRPGDIVCADASGVVVVPRHHLGAVADRIAQVTKTESAVLADFSAGIPLRDARARHGYNQVARQPTVGSRNDLD